ncbi:MAG TPA: serine/threonine protein kinase [Xanthobacteraceae bacterium]|nr:serine/threonine protein kinase [Xanthobacteraceae bacterium]
MVADAQAAPDHDVPSELTGRWRRSVILKRDVFSIVERGTFDGSADAVVRRIDAVPWWSRPIARHFLRREARALAAIGPAAIAPPLLFEGRRVLVRGFIDGVPLHIARPVGDRTYFRSARSALGKLHAAGFTHNDLAKEQNWLRGADGRAYLTDFQLSSRFRGRAFRLAAYEDLRHYLKHKRSYVPDALTATEKRILARKSWVTRIWMATGKKLYIAVTRGLFRFTDREGGGPRLVNDAPVIAAQLKSQARVRDVVVLAFPDRRAGTGLYAFVEGEAGASEDSLREFVAHSLRARAPERLQLVEALPRRADGSVRTEILQLVAMNQVDQVDTLIADETERRIVTKIVADRRNLRDRFTF